MILRNRRRRTATGIAALGLLAGTLASAQPAAALTWDGFVAGQGSFSIKYDGWGIGYYVTANNVAFQGPIGNETAVPKVGERFYLHLWTGAVDSPFDIITDYYRMQLLLPEGLRVDIRATTDVMCNVTDAYYNFKRYMGPGECEDPVKFGVYDQFPAVALGEGEVANFFVPVVADRTFNKDAQIGLVSDPLNNPITALPDPLYATNSKLVVNPALTPPPPPPPPPSDGGDGSAGGGDTGGGTGTGTGTAPGTGTEAGTGTGGGTSGGTSEGTTPPAPPADVKDNSAPLVISAVAKAVAKRSKISVTVSPNLGKAWTVTLRVKKGGAWKKVPGRHVTSNGKITIDAKAGTYRAFVAAAHGQASLRTEAVTLKR